MSKQTEALKLALEALNELIPDVHDWYGAKVHRANAAITAIREALAEQPAQQSHCNDCGGFDPECPLAQPAQGCEFCSHPLYAGTKCKNCGRERPAQQKPVATVQDLDEVKRKHLVYELGFDWKDPLYTSPQPSKPLTFSKLCDIEYEITHRDGDFSILKFARAIEAAHGITGEQK